MRFHFSAVYQRHLEGDRAEFCDVTPSCSKLSCSPLFHTATAGAEHECNSLREAAEAGVFQDLTDVLLCCVEEETWKFFQREAQKEVQKYRAMAPNFTALCVNVLGPQAARV